MSERIRTATPRECEGLWPAVASDHLFATAEAFAAYCREAPWRVRVSDRGGAVLLGRWREHLGVLEMRGVWSSERAVPDFIGDAVVCATAHGFVGVLSPLLPEVLLRRYVSAGMRVMQRIVAIQGHPELVVPADPPLGVVIRPGTRADLPALLELDARCFEEFWRYGPAEFEQYLDFDRLAVAEATGGAIVGYTLANLAGGAATLSRLATAPQARRAGIGRALLWDSAQWARRSGAMTLALCTQEENLASRALYAHAGLTELDVRYAFAIRELA